MMAVKSVQTGIPIKAMMELMLVRKTMNQTDVITLWDVLMWCSKVSMFCPFRPLRQRWCDRGRVRVHKEECFVVVFGVGPSRKV